MHITQNAHRVQGASSRASFHFEENDGGLQCYLPKDEVDREVCFESDLPRRLCEYMCITNPGAAGIIGSVFRQSKSTVIDRVLQRAGVGQVDCDFAALDEEFGAPDVDVEVQTLTERTGNVRLSTPNPAPRSYTPSGWARWKEKKAESAGPQVVHDSRSPSPSRQEVRKDVYELAYESILENVVNTARQRAISGVLETIGVSTTGRLATEPLPLQIIRDAFAARTQERDFKLGAAGELFIFELLKGLGLEGFGLIHWTSSIRDRVKGHRDYCDLPKSSNRFAIADIEYLDLTHKLTEILIEKGHLKKEIWEEERPYYHFEVKATVSSSWQEPFFMSKAQERHVRAVTPVF